MKKKFRFRLPALWLGLVLWLTLIGSFILGLSPIIIYILLSLALLDKIFTLGNAYLIMGAARSLDYSMKAMIATRKLMEEAYETHTKLKKNEEE